MRKTLPYILMTLLLLAAVTELTDASRRAAETQRQLTEAYAAALYQSMEETQALNLSLEKLLISADASRQATLLCEISRTADNIRRSLTALPLSHEAMRETLGYINSLSDYAASLAGNLSQPGTLPDNAISALDRHKTACTQLGAQLALANREMAASGNAISLMSAFADGMSPIDRPAETIGEPVNGITYPAFSETAATAPVPKGITGAIISQADALAIARNFVGTDRVRSVTPAPNTGGTIPAYGITVMTADLQLNLEITRQGGHILWMMPETASFPQLLNVAACAAKAEKFLKTHGFPDTEYAAHEIYNGLCVMTFVPLQDNTLLYPDLIRIQVRMDNGDIVGIETHSYLMNHTARDIAEPSLAEPDARSLLSSQVDAEQGRLCIIPFGSSELLCWEFAVSYGDAQYRIYLDADTGSEIEVRKLLTEPDGLQII